MTEPILSVSDVVVRYRQKRRTLWRTEKAWLQAVRGASLSVGQGEIVGIVGESGCGKSTLARVLAGLEQPSEGTRQLARAKGQGALVQMVFQDAAGALNPSWSVRRTLQEALDAPLARRPGPDIGALLEQVGLNEQVAERFPHELSGGQRQRVAIARSLASQPDVLIADEPVSALDVSVQSQVINLLAELSRSRKMTLVFITHDISLVSYLCERVVVMYLGHIVEQGSVADVLEQPLHPYTRVLLDAAPRMHQPLPVLAPSDPPSPISPPAGCPFHPRCALRVDPDCKQSMPPLRATSERAAHQARCILVGDVCPAPTPQKHEPNAEATPA